jgi:hypothetical protein
MTKEKHEIKLHLFMDCVMGTSLTVYKARYLLVNLLEELRILEGKKHYSFKYVEIVIW